VENRKKLKNKKTDMLKYRKQSGKTVESVRKKKGRLRWDGFTEKGFKPGMKE